MPDCRYCHKDFNLGPVDKDVHKVCLAEKKRRKSLNICILCGLKPRGNITLTCGNCRSGDKGFQNYHGPE